jgi:hypothetical protein
MDVELGLADHQPVAFVCRKGCWSGSLFGRARLENGMCVSKCRGTI